MKRISLFTSLLIITLYQVQGQGYLQLDNCIKFKCSTILTYNETQAQPLFYSDSDKFNSCQADNDNCYLNQYRYESDDNDKKRAQLCYDDCYDKDEYQNDYFKFFLRCSWNCAENVYGINNNFNKFQFKPGHIVSICLIIASTLTMAIRGVQVYKTKKNSLVNPLK